ncbi:MAG TPA: hypothetical protein VHV82_16420 [Sporichthyaceae bacterium]|nr:hypothetical protein [Sporichthyaceae bacterium]
MSERSDDAVHAFDVLRSDDGVSVSDLNWEAATFDGAAAAQADAVADLTPTQRVELLEHLLEMATASGALQRSRQDKQHALDLLWRT